MNVGQRLLQRAPEARWKVLYGQKVSYLRIFHAASLVSLPVIRESLPGRCRRDDHLDAHSPRPAYIDVCTQPDQIPDLSF